MAQRYPFNAGTQRAVVGHSPQALSDWAYTANAFLAVNRRASASV